MSRAESIEQKHLIVADEEDREVGTLLWMAPEVITGAAYNCKVIVRKIFDYVKI